MLVLQITFWVSLFIILWVYFGYYLALQAISLFHQKKVSKQNYLPDVSMVITVFNEGKRIMQKIENTLKLVYPKDKLEVIVVSDGSSDKTEELVSSFRDKGVKLLAIPARHGKHYCQGQGVAVAKGEIIVLTDATTFLKEDAIEKIMRNFADPRIGCVSGMDRVKEADSNVTGEGQYVKYEMKLRALESEVGSLVGASGCFFAVRKVLCQTWYGGMSSDFYLPIISYMKGYRTVLEPEATGFYEVLKASGEEFKRKVRTVAHGLQVLSQFSEIMNPFRYGLYSLQMISHKLLRWLVPICLVMLFIGNLFLLGRNLVYCISFIGQVIFYVIALSAVLFKKLQHINLFKIPFVFVMANCSILVAWYKFIIGEGYVEWEPTKR